MSWSGSLEVKRGCECNGTGRNPPELVDPRAISETVAELGRALAIGELAAAAGLPDGASLANQVSAFVESSPTLERAYRVLETGSAVGLALKPAWKAVRSTANATLATLRRNRSLLGTIGIVGGGFALGAQFFDSKERVALAEIATRYAFVGDQLAELTPQERVAALGKLGDIIGPDGSSGPSFWTLAGLALVVVGGVYAWRKWGSP